MTGTWPRKSVATMFALVVGTGCYDPHPQWGAPCSADGECPSGEWCVTRRCTLDGAPNSGGIPDAPVIIAPDAPVAPTDLCMTTDTCEGASMVGTISGDTGHDTLHATGSTTAWLRVRATEDDFIDNVPMRVAVSLVVPDGADFDIDIYVNRDNDVVECASTIGTHSTNGATKVVSAQWGSFTDLQDDSRDVSIAIRATGACSPDLTWQLTIEGNVSAPDSPSASAENDR